MNLKELSEVLGLSQTTVSRALNGYPEVSETTRKRVIVAARQHGYRPNSRAKGLATGRSMAIGHVIPTSSRHEMVNPIFGDFISGAGEVYSAAGYDMLLSIVGDTDEAKAYRELKARGAVDGIIIHGPTLEDPRIPLLRELGMPFIVHGRSSGETAPYHWIDMDNRRAFDKATEHLISIGHRRIALLNGLEHMDFASRRRNGFEAALRRAGLRADPDLMRSEEMTEEYGYREAKALCSCSDRPTAFVVSSLITAFGVRRALDEARLQVGRDVSIVTHDDALSYMLNGGDTPFFTATRSSVKEAGRRAATMLLEVISDPECNPRTELLESEFLIGKTTGPLAATPQSA